MQTATATATAAPALPASVQISAPEFLEIPISTILLSDTALQILRRKRFTKETLAELATDIRARGVMEPVLVRAVSGKAVGIKYELVCGERRLLASKEAGKAHIPALIRPFNDVELIGAQFAENMEREGYHELEEAKGYQLLCQAHKCDAKALVTRGIVSKNEAHVHARLKLLDLCPEVSMEFYAGKVNASVALLISRIIGADKQVQALKGCLMKDDKALGKYTPGEYDGPLTHVDAKDYIQQEFIVYQDGARAIEDARKKGIKVKPIAETKDLWKREYAPPAGHVFVEDLKGKLGDQPAAAVLMQNPHTGEAKLVIKKDKAIAEMQTKKIALPADLKPRQTFKHHSGNASSGTSNPAKQDAASAEKEKAKRERAEREFELSIKIQLATFKAVRAKTPPKCGKAELIELIDLLEDVSYLSREHAPMPKAKDLAKCQERDLVRFVLDYIYAYEIEDGDYNMDKLLAAAKRYGVNAAAIAKDLTEEFEEEEAKLAPKKPAPIAAKPAKKKASKK